ncbi:hypothetical protein MAHJHV50_50520 [Mycobacterium avium subsp. hominissuis]
MTIEEGQAAPASAPLLLVASLCVAARAGRAVTGFHRGCFAGSVSLLTYTAYQSYCLLYG